MEELICSRRQFFREQHKALMLLAALLWDRLPQPEATAADPLLAEAGLILAQREVVEPRDVVQGVIGAIGPLAEQHGVAVACDVRPHLPSIRANRTLLRQVLLRALSELIARPGTREISVRLDVAGQRVRIELAAHGSAPATLTGTSEPPLEAARRLAEMVGGRWERSRRADGADICCFSLPTGEGPDRVLLVIEDNEGVIRAFRRYLAGSRYRVVGATSGAQALRLARELAPAAITLDVMMPTQDGWEVLQALKNDPGTREIPVVVCSALDDPDLARSLQAAAFLRKPISQADLVSALSGLASGGGDEGGPDASSRARK